MSSWLLFRISSSGQTKELWEEKQTRLSAMAGLHLSDWLRVRRPNSSTTKELREEK
jgi:hypothetical protein